MYKWLSEEPIAWRATSAQMRRELTLQTDGLRRRESGMVWLASGYTEYFSPVSAL